MEVVEMQVRDQDGVDTTRQTARDRSAPTVQVHQGGSQYRVGEYASPILHEHGRVAEPVEVDGHVLSMATCWKRDVHP